MLYYINKSNILNKMKGLKPFTLNFGPQYNAASCTYKLKSGGYFLYLVFIGPFWAFFINYYLNKFLYKLSLCNWRMLSPVSIPGAGLVLDDPVLLSSLIKLPVMSAPTYSTRSYPFGHNGSHSAYVNGDLTDGRNIKWRGHNKNVDSVQLADFLQMSPPTRDNRSPGSVMSFDNDDDDRRTYEFTWVEDPRPILVNKSTLINNSVIEVNFLERSTASVAPNDVKPYFYKGHRRNEINGMTNPPEGYECYEMYTGYEKSYGFINPNFNYYPPCKKSLDYGKPPTIYPESAFTLPTPTEVSVMNDINPSDNFLNSVSVIKLPSLFPLTWEFSDQYTWWHPDKWRKISAVNTITVEELQDNTNCVTKKVQNIQYSSKVEDEFDYLYLGDFDLILEKLPSLNDFIQLFIIVLL